MEYKCTCRDFDNATDFALHIIQNAVLDLENNNQDEAVLMLELAIRELTKGK